MTGVTLTLAGRRITPRLGIWVLANDVAYRFVNVEYLSV